MTKRYYRIYVVLKRFKVICFTAINDLILAFEWQISSNASMSHIFNPSAFFQKSSNKRSQQDSIFWRVDIQHLKSRHQLWCNKEPSNAIFLGITKA